MLGNCCGRCGCRSYCRNRYGYRRNCCDNGCNEFLLPIMFLMVRDMTRHCRCNHVDRYDGYRR